MIQVRSRPNRRPVPGEIILDRLGRRYITVTAGSKIIRVVNEETAEHQWLAILDFSFPEKKEVVDLNKPLVSREDLDKEFLQ